MIDSGLRLFLLEHPGLTELIGTRIYPALMPEDETLPGVVYTQISYGDTYSNGGTCHARARYQIDSYGSTLNEARQVDDIIRSVLGGYQGRWSGKTVTAFQRNTSVERMDEESTWRITSDYVIHITG